MSFAEAMAAGSTLEKRSVVLPVLLFQNYVSLAFFPVVGTVFLPAPEFR